MLVADFKNYGKIICRSDIGFLSLVQISLLVDITRNLSGNEVKVRLITILLMVFIFPAGYKNPEGG